MFLPCVNKASSSKGNCHVVWYPFVFALFFLPSTPCTLTTVTLHTRPSTLPGGVQPAAGSAKESKRTSNRCEKLTQNVTGQCPHHEGPPQGNCSKDHVSLTFVVLLFLLLYGICHCVLFHTTLITYFSLLTIFTYLSMKRSTSLYILDYLKLV